MAYILNLSKFQIGGDAPVPVFTMTPSKSVIASVPGTTALYEEFVVSKAVARFDVRPSFKGSSNFTFDLLVELTASEEALIASINTGLLAALPAHGLEGDTTFASLLKVPRVKGAFKPTMKVRIYGWDKYAPTSDAAPWTVLAPGTKLGARTTLIRRVIDEDAQTTTDLTADGSRMLTPDDIDAGNTLSVVCAMPKYTETATGKINVALYATEVVIHTTAPVASPRKGASSGKAAAGPRVPRWGASPADAAGL